MRRAVRSLLAPLREPATWAAGAHLLGGAVAGVAALVLAGAAHAAGGPWAAAAVLAAVTAATAAVPGLLGLERRQAAWALGLVLPAGSGPSGARAGTAGRLAAWLGVRALAGLAAGAVAVGAALLAALGVVLPWAEDFLVWDTWTSPSGLRAAWLLPAGLACGLLGVHAVRWLGRLEAAAGARLLGPSPGERSALLQARTRALEERELLARDLHDSVGHAVTATMLQAAAARAVLRTDPDHAAQALGTIERLGRQTMEELDRMLALLRREGGPGGGPGDVEALVGELRLAGLPVALDVDGPLDLAPPAVREAVHRIVQEAATNVLRHAGPVPTRVRVAVGPDAVEVEVRDAGAPGGREPAPAGAGRGLPGMRERVALLGGRLEAGAAEPGGWRVRAVLPR